MDSSRSHVVDAQTFKIAGVVSFYMCAALVMVFVNKAVMNSSPELPLFFLFIQLAIAVILLHTAAAFTPKVDIPKLDLKTAKKLLPVTLVNVIGLLFNILCLRGVEASFFQIARGLVLPLTITASSLHTHSLPSIRVVVAALIVTVGFLLGIAPESMAVLRSLDTWYNSPILYGILSSVFIAIHTVLIKMSLPHAHNSTIQLAYWQNLGSALFLAPCIVFYGEFTQLTLLMNRRDWNGQVFAWGSAITGVFGFLLCVAGLLSIKITSPITHMFSSAARSVIQTLLGVWLFGDILTTNRATSIVVILFGTLFYTWVKSTESAPRPAASKEDIESRKSAEERAAVVDWQKEKTSDD